MNLTKYVASWFARGDEDLAAAKILLDHHKGSLNLACFHAQQAAEKYLKGFLAHHEKHVRKIHDLVVLLQECKEIEQSFDQLGKNINYLSKLYFESRYPDDYVEFHREDAENAFKAAMHIKEVVLSKIKSQKMA